MGHNPETYEAVAAGVVKLFEDKPDVALLRLRDARRSDPTCRAAVGAFEWAAEAEEDVADWIDPVWKILDDFECTAWELLVQNRFSDALRVLDAHESITNSSSSFESFVWSTGIARAFTCLRLRDLEQARAELRACIPLAAEAVTEEACRWALSGRTPDYPSDSDLPRLDAVLLALCTVVGHSEGASNPDLQACVTDALVQFLGNRETRAMIGGKE